MKNKIIKFALVSIMILLLITSCKDADNTNNTQSNNNQNNQNSSSNQPSDNNDGQDDEVSEEPSKLIQASWETSKHSGTYVLDSLGNNITCAQCHSPSNWVPSMDDVPESCLVCKFEITEPEPLVEEHEWGNIPCVTCHKLDKDGNVLPEVFYLEIAAIEEYVEVETNTELCQMCHRSLGGVAMHPGTQISGAHVEFGCDDCHDPHSNDATCSSEDCHSTFGSETTAIPGHDMDHQLINCSACHDGSNLYVGPITEAEVDCALCPPEAADTPGVWTSFIVEEDNKVPFTSHNIVLSVACDRCHYPDNPWDLSGAVDQP